MNLITGDVIGAAFRIHSALGPGLLESVYEVVLARDLARRGYRVERQKPISFEFEGMVFTEGFRADLLVEGAIVVEVKSVALLAPVHARQVLTYLRLLDYPVGLLINFGVARLREGIKNRERRLQGRMIAHTVGRSHRELSVCDPCGLCVNKSVVPPVTPGSARVRRRSPALPR